MSILKKTKIGEFGEWSWQIFEMIGLTADFLPDRFLSSLAGEEEEVDWAD
jgi:hypothetical protein